MNKCKAPKIPPIVVNNSFLIDAKEKAHEFIKYFSSQCTPIENDRMLPDLHLIHSVTIRLPIVVSITGYLLHHRLKERSGSMRKPILLKSENL